MENIKRHVVFAVKRVSVTRLCVGGLTLDGGTTIPEYRSSYGPVVGLPEPKDGVTYLVSGMVRLASAGRPDVVSPGELLRGPDGQPVGCVGVEV